MSKQNELAQLADAVTVDGSNVGIGAAPSAHLTAGYNLRLDGGAQTYLAFNNDTHTTQVLGGFVIGNDSSAARITQRENQPIIFATSDTDRMKIDASGAVTMPNQPAFLVKPTTSSQQLNIAVNQAVNIVFGTEVFDQNADFSSSAFTAPVTGKYFFSVGLAVQNLDSAANFYEIYIRASNRTLGFTMDPDFGQDAAYWQFNASGLIDMDAGDTCDIQIYQGAGSPQTDIRTVSYFSGYLVA